MKESRVKKSILNAKVNLLFFVITLFVSFFSRKIFLENLGDDFVGLTGTLMNLLGFLNLAELGIGSAIGYVLYKPLYDKDERRINEIISVFGFLYKKVGYFILLSGILLAMCLPFIFPNTSVSFGIIYFAFFSFLATSLLSYFVNYKQTLLGADQKNYVVTAYFQTAALIKTIVQIVLAYHTRNPYLWVAIELVFGIVYSIILNVKIRQVYPWLKSSIALGKEKYPENKIIMQKTKQLFVHLLAGTARYQLLPFLVYAYTSLKIVAFYGNYLLITTKINMLIRSLLGSTGAGVGNLIAENDKKKILRVFWELNSLQFFIASFCSFSLYHLMDPFIGIWLGREYVLPKIVVVIITLNFFITQFRLTTDQFIHGYGLYHDVWAPIATLIITVVVALIGGHLWGLPGVLIGDIASSATIISIWKPYMLYNVGFKTSVWLYWKNMLKYAVILSVSWFIADFLINLFPLANPYAGYKDWLIYSAYVLSVFTFTLIILMYSFLQGTRDFLMRFIHKKDRI